MSDEKNDDKNEPKPLVYSCSGCSSAAQLANALALGLDQGGNFEMSCIAGVGAKVKSFVKQAQSGRDILCIDGCPIKCASRCLEAVSVSPRWHFLISDLDIAKRKHELPQEVEVLRASLALTRFLKEDELDFPVMPNDEEKT